MNNNELLMMLETIEQERGINKVVIIEAIEKSLMSASKKSIIHPADRIDVKIDRVTGEIKAFATLTVVDAIPNKNQILLLKAKEKYPKVKVGDEIQVEVTPSNFGRIAAQQARQGIITQLKDAEKLALKDEYEPLIGELVHGVVRMVDNGNITVNMGKCDAILPRREKLPREEYMVNERITALLLKVDTEIPGPSLILTRTHRNFVVKLFEREVSEITDGIVEILGISREPGGRSKVCVKSNDESIDPVGSCVGVRGSRVRNITSELGGERIDIVPFSEDMSEFVANALKPAEIDKVEFKNEDNTDIVVYVKTDQARLVFGRKAQNVKLAAKLLKAKINIIELKDEEEESFEDIKTKTINALSESLSIDAGTATVLVDNGYLSLDGLKEADANDLKEIEGIEGVVMDKIIAILED